MAGLRVIYGTLIGVSLIGEEPRQMGVQSKSSPNLHEAEKAVSRAEAQWIPFLAASQLCRGGRFVGTSLEKITYFVMSKHVCGIPSAGICERLGAESRSEDVPSPVPSAASCSSSATWAVRGKRLCHLVHPGTVEDSSEMKLFA